MSAALKAHWPSYLAEAAGLLVFMVGAGGFTTLFEHPDSPVRQALPDALPRHLALGATMGLVTAGILYSPWAQRSGGHINPAVTWAFFRQGKIGAWDAVFYTASQFLGAMLAPHLVFWALGARFTHPFVKFATTQPGPAGAGVAFLAEFAISLLLMLVMLLAVNSRRWHGKAGLLAALLIALYIGFESPLSGMSMNPARSFGSALAAGQWDGIWLYFAAPVLAMLLAVEIFGWMRRHRWVLRCEDQDSAVRFPLVRDFAEGPHYPVDVPDRPAAAGRPR